MSIKKITLIFQALASFLLPTVLATDVATLNRVTFTGNIFSNREGEGPEGWIVLFCAPWFENCKKFTPAFVATAAEHESNDDLFSRKTRFAQVDCAVDKVLCNSQDVDMYPTIVHYRRGGRAGEWTSSGRTLEKETKSFRKWLTKQMQMPDKPLNVVVDESLGAAGLPATTSFTMGVSVTQSAPMLVAVAAGTMWICRFIPELQQGFQLLRDTLPGDRSAAAKKEEAQAQLEEPADQVPSVVRNLPESWAKRESIEL